MLNGWSGAANMTDTGRCLEIDSIAGLEHNLQSCNTESDRSVWPCLEGARVSRRTVLGIGSGANYSVSDNVIDVYAW